MLSTLAFNVFALACVVTGTMIVISTAVDLWKSRW